MKVATAADLQLPELAVEETENLTAACLADRDHKTMPPVVIWQCGKKWLILDGHNQHRIREANGLKIRYHKVTFDTRAEARVYAINAQLSRRNFDRDQYAYWLAERDKELRLCPGRPENNVANFATLDGMAKEAGVSKRTMQDATKVADKGAESVKQGVASGDFAVSDGAAIADLSERRQEAIVKKASREGTTLRAAAKPSNGEEKKKDRQLGEGDSLEDVQADLKEMEKRLREVARLMRKVLDISGEDKRAKRAYCGMYSMVTMIHPIEHVARVIKNDMPVGGTPKKPILYREEKVKGLSK